MTLFYLLYPYHLVVDLYIRFAFAEFFAIAIIPYLFIYTYQLVEEELTTHLHRERDRYDLIVCADTLCYFGDLEPVLGAAMHALKTGGRLIFSVELLQDNDSGDYQINTSGRYSHTRGYILGQVAGAGLTLVDIEEAEIRNEANKPVAGLIVEALAEP